MNRLSPSIIFTMGPSTLDEKKLTEILSLPVSYVRFNMSHGSHDDHKERLEMVRRVAKSLDRDVKVFADLCGPKIRVTKIPGEMLDMITGSTVRLVHELCDDSSFEISYKDLYMHVKEGDRIALDDGKLLLKVMRVEDKDIVLSVLQGGKLLNEKGVNILDVDLPIDSFTEKDRSDALFAIKEGFDAIALSFVKKKSDIEGVRSFLNEHSGAKLPIIAKIETRQALHEIGNILEAVDMIMVARGDLGIEIPIEKIPIVQKELTFLSNEKNVPVIVATEMLKSMTKNPFPTRAEITDCITALLDGASFIMLSDETTTGEYPVEAVKIMSSVISEFIHHKKQYSLFDTAH